MQAAPIRSYGNRPFRTFRLARRRGAFRNPYCHYGNPDNHRARIPGANRIVAHVRAFAQACLHLVRQIGRRVPVGTPARWESVAKAPRRSLKRKGGFGCGLIGLLKEGAPTVGIGHKAQPGDNLREGDRISRQRATQFFLDDVASAQRRARALLGDLPVTQNEFDAVVDMMFNVAPVALTPAKSPQLHAAVRARDHVEIGNQLRYTRDRSGGSPPGLVYRNDRRQNIYRDGNYANVRRPVR